MREALLAIQLERRYTKREIFAFYANQIYFGHGAYGVEPPRASTSTRRRRTCLEEAAMIAAIIQAPERLSPFVDPKRTTMRRNYVLQRMVDEGLVSTDAAAAAIDRPIAVLRGAPTPERSIAPYFVEDIRKSLEQKYGAKALYEPPPRADDARRRSAGGGERGARSRAAAHRQAAQRIPQARAQHRGRRPSAGELHH